MKLHNSFLDSKRTVILSSTIMRSRSALFVLAAFTQNETVKCLYFILVSAEGARTDAACWNWCVPDRITAYTARKYAQTTELR